MQEGRAARFYPDDAVVDPRDVTRALLAACRKRASWPCSLEATSFLQRAKEAFDGVFMLVVVHHFLATEGIPLFEIFRLAHELTREFLIIEYVDPADPMFIQLARGRETLFENFSREAFEAVGKRFFDIVRVNPLGSTRLLYVMVKKKIS